LSFAVDNWVVEGEVSELLGQRAIHLAFVCFGPFSQRRPTCNAWRVVNLLTFQCLVVALVPLLHLGVSMSKAIYYLLSLFFAIGLSFPYVSFAKDQLAVVDLKAGHRVEKSLAEAFSVRIRDDIHGLGDYEVLSKEDLEVIAEKKKLRQSLGCDDTECLIGLGRQIGTQYIVAGSVSKLGSTYYVNLRLIDTEGDDAGVKKRVSKDCFCTQDELFETGTAKVVVAMVMGKEEPHAQAARAPTPEAIANSLEMKFVLIPAGTFMMGSPPEEPGRANDEKQHWVTISRPFYMQISEVTQGQWKRVMEEDDSRFKFKDCGDDCPAEMVSWLEAQEFIKRLNEMEKTDKYRLPTEAEWEYACRAGSATPFYTGDCISTDQANYKGKDPLKTPPSECPGGEYRKSIVEAGSFSPNPLGLYDMHGNVWEWCQDWEDAYPVSHVIDPKGPSSGKDRVLRGGSWYDEARNLRSARRFKYSPYYRDGDIGFRVVKDS
jgi:formylglycine-generating enzyme required for sulfatase activity